MARANINSISINPEFIKAVLGKSYPLFAPYVELYGAEYKLTLKLPFGKYKGKDITDVGYEHPEYMEFLIDSLFTTKIKVNTNENETKGDLEFLVENGFCKEKWTQEDHDIFCSAMKVLLLAPYKMSFGKYKGKDLSDVPQYYLRWLLKQLAINNDFLGRLSEIKKNIMVYKIKLYIDANESYDAQSYDALPNLIT